MPTKKAVKAAEPSAIVGKKVPKFNLPSTSGSDITADDLKNAVLYFYPKDNTSGCTKESEDFRDLHAKFKKLGIKIFGVSRDNMKSHNKFKEKFSFPFELISDEEEKLCKAFDVIKEKSLYGRKYMGVDRSTFFIGKDGKVQHEWRGVKVPGHADAVYDYVKNQK